jgi:hypothetical protein
MVVIDNVTINPNPVYAGAQFIISVDIYVLYPSNSLYPTEDLYPTPDTGAIRPDKHPLYPADHIYPADSLYPRP